MNEHLNKSCCFFTDATEKIDTVLASDDAFAPVASDIDEMKITVCADMFVTLLQTIMERYEALPQPGHRLQFLELQLELLDDFRLVGCPLYCQMFIYF